MFLLGGIVSNSARKSTPCVNGASESTTAAGELGRDPGDFASIRWITFASSAGQSGRISDTAGGSSVASAISFLIVVLNRDEAWGALPVINL